MELRKRVLSIGAHPDDADTSCGGLLKKLADRGWEVRLLSVTDGSRGTFHPEMVGEKLKEIRRQECKRSGAVFGGRYDMLDHVDTRLQADVETREELIRYIRVYAPDLIITHRAADTHPDHRNTALLVQDAAYLLTIPSVCPEVPYLAHEPVILAWHDSFRTPYPCRPDVIVPIDDTLGTLVQAASCHESQYFDLMYWPDNVHKIGWPRERQIADLAERYDRLFNRFRMEYAKEIARKFGKEADSIRHVEVFEICEHGTAPSPEFVDFLEK